MYVRFVCLAAFSSSCCGVTRVGAMEKILTYFETATPSAIFHYCSVCVLFTVKQCSSTTFDIWDSSKNQYKVTANQNFGSHINELYPGKEKVIEVWPRIKCFANIPNQPLSICCPAGFGEGHHFAIWSTWEGQVVDFPRSNRNTEGFLVTDHCLRRQCECEEWMSGWKKHTLF